MPVPPTVQALIAKLRKHQCSSCPDQTDERWDYVNGWNAALAELEALLTAAPEAPEGWQPIATAPEGVMTLWCSMTTHDVSKWCFVDWRAGGKFMLHPKWDATHWRPLPSPPAPSEGTQEA